MSEFRDFIKVVYLSAPMDQLSADKDVEEKYSMSKWRERAEKYFSKKGIQVINPVRTTRKIKDRWIIEGDKLAIRHADALLVNYTQLHLPGVNGKIVKGTGTTMEIIYAHERGKVVVIYDENREAEELSVWLREHASIIVSSRIEALKWINSLNNKRLYPDLFASIEEDLDTDE